ncbi:MAG: MOSC domain-containing protein [Anaerolineales bacterium]|nr:MOSC domain-containing protein [Anaerolineales bacterium]
MKIISINAGKQQTQINKGRTEITGIYKTALQGSVQITSLGIADDFIGSPKHHGGPDQALYVYGEADYQWWAKEIGRDMPPGMFGENLTISELESAFFNIGDFLHIGEVTLQATAPRIPCSTFATRMGDPQWVKKFRAAERPGLYVRVIREGRLAVGEEVWVEKYSGETVSLVEMYRDYYESNKNEETLRKLLNAPVAIRAREDFEKDLAELKRTG